MPLCPSKERAKQTEQSTALFQSGTEVSAQGKPLPLRLERQVDPRSHSLPEQRFGSRNHCGNQRQRREARIITDKLLEARCGQVRKVNNSMETHSEGGLPRDIPEMKEETLLRLHGH